MITMGQLQGRVLPSTCREQIMNGWNPAAVAAEESIEALKAALDEDKVPPTQRDEISSLISRASNMVSNPPTYSDVRPEGAQDGKLTWTNFARR